MYGDQAAVTAPTTEGQTPAEPQGKVMKRDTPDPTAARQALVKRILGEIKLDEKYWNRAFRKMRWWMRFARGIMWDLACNDQYWDDDDDDERYVANIVQRHIQQQVASLYAKNPTFVARRAQRLDFAVWDGKSSTVQTAMQALQSGMIDPLNPEASAVGMAAIKLQQDIAQGVTRRTMLDRVARTLEINYAHCWKNHLPNMKRQMKQLVRRAKICGVGYVKLGYQRTMAHSPDAMRQMDDITQRIARMQSLSADIADGEIQPDSASAEELMLSMKALQANPDIIIYEGLTWTFPRSTNIIPDRRTTQLNGFVGSSHVSEKFCMSCQDIKDVYGVDIKAGKGQYTSDEVKTFQIIRDTVKKNRDTKEEEHLVYHMYHKPSGLVYVVCDGYPDFLVEPTEPSPRLEKFYPWFVLAFNDVEDEDNIFPISDVELMRHAQIEYNNAREGLSEHRRHGAPFYVSKVPLEEEDKDKLRTRMPFEILTLNAANSSQGVKDLIQQFENAAIDSNLYDTSPLYEDILRTVGSDESGMGTADPKTTATASSIAEGARSQSIASNVDDLDDMLTEMAREGGQLLLAELSPEMATKIAGPGAIWPQLSRAEIAQEIYLEVEAGSSGRPNKAQDLANFERAAPLLLQTPGITPESFARYALRTLDDRIDLDEMVSDGLPSMVAQNALAAKPQADAMAAGGQPGAAPQPQVGGNGAQDPNMQGAQGGQNAPVAQGSQPGAQAGRSVIQYDKNGKRAK